MAQRRGDVARKAGVSEATVSRVLNGRPGRSESTRAAVLTALDVLGYGRPTQPRGDRPERETPIPPGGAEGVRGGPAQQGFTPVLSTRTAGGLSEAAYVNMLIQQQVSGVVFAGGHFAEDDSPHDHYRLLHDRGVPVMLVNAAVDQLGFPRVSTDDVVASEQAFGHLWSLGHTRIGAIMGPADQMPTRRKLAALAAEGQRAGLTVAVEHALFSIEGGHAAGTRLIEAGVTVCSGASDQLALGAGRAARPAGLAVPDQLSG